MSGRPVALEFLDGEAVAGAWPHWERLLRYCDTDTAAQPLVFLEPPWLRAWLRHFGGGVRPGFLALVARGRWLAALPVAVTGASTGARLLALGGDHVDSVDIPAVDDDARRRFLAMLLGRPRDPALRWATLHLRNLPGSGPTRTALERARTRWPGRIRIRATPAAPVLALRGTAPQRSRNLRSQLARTMRRLHSMGHPEILVSRPSPSDADRLLARAAEVEGESWKARASCALLRGPGLAFCEELWRTYAAQGRILFGGLELDGELVAYHWGVEDTRRFLSYNLAHRSRFDHLGPGTLLLDRMLETLRRTGVHFADAGHGAEEAATRHPLARYPGDPRAQCSVTLYGNTGAARLVSLARRLAGSL